MVYGMHQIVRCQHMKILPLDVTTHKLRCCGKVHVGGTITILSLGMNDCVQLYAVLPKDEGVLTGLRLVL